PTKPWIARSAFRRIDTNHSHTLGPSNKRIRDNKKLSAQLKEAQDAGIRDAARIRELECLIEELRLQVRATTAQSVPTLSTAALEDSESLGHHSSQNATPEGHAAVCEGGLEMTSQSPHRCAGRGGDTVPDQLMPEEPPNYTDENVQPASPRGMAHGQAPPKGDLQDIDMLPPSERTTYLDLASDATNLWASPIINWAAGVTTRLPMLPGTKFEFDEAMVRAMATFPRAEDTDMVVFLDWDPGNSALVMGKIASAQAEGHWVVVRGAGKKFTPLPGCTEHPTMNLQYLSSELGKGVVGAALDVNRQAHDMELRMKANPPPEEDSDPTDAISDDSVDEEVSDTEATGSQTAEAEGPPEPYVERTLRQFVEEINSDKHIRAILDIPGGYLQHDPITTYLSDGHLEVFTVSHAIGNVDYEFRPADHGRTFDWHLAHQGGFVTFGHIDASGLGTTFEVRGPGAKLWLALEYCPPSNATRAMLIQGQKSVVLGVPRRAHRPQQTDDGAGREDFSVDGNRKIRGCIIVVQEGDRVIQPPGKGHTVYTPLHTITAGKHYVNWDSLHHMELCRAFEKHTSRTATNHDHAYAQLMLIFMAASLPARVKEGRVFFRKPLIALCLMVLWPRKYIHADSIEDRVGKRNDEPAQTFLRRLRNDGGRWVCGNIDRLAQLACIAVLKELVPPELTEGLVADQTAIPQLPDIQPIRESYLFQDSDDHSRWQIPGPQVDLRHCVEPLLGWTPLDNDPVLVQADRDAAALNGSKRRSRKQTGIATRRVSRFADDSNNRTEATSAIRTRSAGMATSMWCQLLGEHGAYLFSHRTIFVAGSRTEFGRPSREWQRKSTTKEEE
ncbi:hypothetical protein GGG16DRAFT_106948, partial [Schizophyllum commune]